MPLTTLLPDPLSALMAAALAVALALVMHTVVFRVMKRVAQRSDSKSDGVQIKRLSSPTRVSLIALALVLVAREAPMLEAAWAKVASFIMPILVGWMVLAILRALIESMKLRANISVEDNLKARRKRTKLTMLNRLVTFIVVFVVVGLVLLSIPGVRDIGVTLVASAGLASLAVGAAAQPALKSLIAGVQMALTEPINIDDVVIVEGEWGWIEDIHTTYVVVKIWDERRLIVPTNYFLEKTLPELDEINRSTARRSQALPGSRHQDRTSPASVRTPDHRQPPLGWAVSDRSGQSHRARRHRGSLADECQGFGGLVRTQV